MCTPFGPVGSPTVGESVKIANGRWVAESARGVVGNICARETRDARCGGVRQRQLVVVVYRAQVCCLTVGATPQRGTGQGGGSGRDCGACCLSEAPTPENRRNERREATSRRGTSLGHSGTTARSHTGIIQGGGGWGHLRGEDGRARGTRQRASAIAHGLCGAH